jgi:hypothetical protein
MLEIRPDGNEVMKLTGLSLQAPGFLKPPPNPQ